jgi:glucose/arabinose dehydrogenase/mono/diheme cytochrome c family protein
MSRIAWAVLVLGATCAHGTLITQRVDTDGAGAVANGSLAANEYGPGNSYSFTGGGSGFSGWLGNSTLYANSDGLRLYLGFGNLGINGNADQYLIYLDTRAGGYQTDGEMSDTSDGGRANVTRFTRDGTDRVTFSNGAFTAKADFALLFNNRTAGGGGFSALFELRGTGTNHTLVSHQAAGLGGNTPEFGILLSDLGLTPTSVVNLAVLSISDTGFASNEGLPYQGLGSNPGFSTNTTTITLTNFHQFVPVVAGPYTGLAQRVPNITLRMPSTLPTDAPKVYAVENAFPGLVFTNPMAVATPPGETNRVFVVERAGRIVVITNLAAPSRTVFLDIASKVNGGGEGGLLGLAFHPGYASNRQYFVFYTATGAGFSNRISRFEVSSTNANYSSPTSEVAFIGQYDDCSNHNAGDLAFGPDGYLYITSGDEGGGNDDCNGGNSQRIDKDFFSSIFRIDVDKKPGSLPPNHHASIVAPTNYAIPPDNPFIGATQFNGSAVNSNAVRTEIYAPGFRNPFRISFDEVTGLLYAGDVGQGSREEIDIVQKGRNYGWKWREGRIATPGIGSPPAGFTNWANPVLDIPRSSGSNYYGNVITGGRVYRGDRLPELVGHYIFSDYGSGFVWSMTHDGTNAVLWQYLLSDADLVYFGRDPRNGDLLMCDLVANQVKRPVYGAASTNALPATLADAGVFHDLETLTPFEGVVPYALNVPFWSDNAIKSRWFSVPSTNLVITFDAEAAWDAPTGTVWIKHFDLLLTNGDPASVRRLETRLLVKNASGSGGYGVTYRWGTSMENATLVPEAGLDEAIVIDDGGGIIRTQLWRYPSRSECLACHQASASFALGFSTPQLNRDYAYAPGDVTNQMRRLSAAGYFHTNVASTHLLRALAHATNTAYSLEYRVRSYLQANCANCHFPGGPTPAAWDARIVTPLSGAGIVDGELANPMGNPTNVVAKPGLLANSMIHHRISLRGTNQMPPLGSTVVDTQSVALVAAWITGALTNYQTFAEWQLAHFGSTNHPDAQPEADVDQDGTPNELEFLTGKIPTNDASAWGVGGLETSNGFPQVIYEQVANRGFRVQVTTNLLDPDWSPLDVPANRPFFAATTTTVTVDEASATNSGERYYRVGVFEP